MLAVDQAQDLNGQALYRLTSLYGAPPFVKSASSRDLAGSELPPHMYADQLLRRYPCHTAAATWASAAFFYDTQAREPVPHAELVESRIKQAADEFGIGSQITTLAGKIATAAVHDESLLADEDFAIVIDYDGAAPKERLYPMRSAKEVKTAAEYLSQHANDLRFADRRQIATKIVEKGLKFGAALHEHQDMLDRMTGNGVCAASDAAAMLRQRASYAPDTPRMKQAADGFAQLADGLLKNPYAAHRPGVLTQVAELVDAYDVDCGLTSRYGKSLERPEDVLFGVTAKLAAELDNELVGSLTGRIYKRADLQRLPVPLLSQYMGDDFTYAVTGGMQWVDGAKIAQVVPTLPLGDAKTFDAVAAEAGIAPFAEKEASAEDRIGMTRDEERAIASLHQPRPGSLWSYMTPAGAKPV